MIRAYPEDPVPLTSQFPSPSPCPCPKAGTGRPRPSRASRKNAVSLRAPGCYADGLPLFERFGPKRRKKTSEKHGSFFPAGFVVGSLRRPRPAPPLGEGDRGDGLPRIRRLPPARLRTAGR